MLDFIIVGQGIAGSMLSWFLLKAGKSVCVIDPYNPSSASNIASGITNPITGRKFVKTWLADELLPLAADTYHECELVLGGKFLKPVTIVKLFDSIKAQNDWSVRCATSGYKAYLKNESVVYLDKSRVNNEYGGFEINGGIQLDTTSFLLAYRNFLQDKEALIGEKFEMPELKLEAQFVTYKNLQAHKIIFCEGASAIRNPYFKNLPFFPAKGECLIIGIPGFNENRIINGEVFIMPLDGTDKYYVGSTHEWHFDDDLPSEKGKQELLDGLHGILKAPYEIVGHYAAIRPTVTDRRPYIGFMPNHPLVGIFNGMGTKGISLAPYFARHFVENVIEGKPLMKEVNIKRVLF